MRKRRKILLVALPAVIAVIILGVFVLRQTLPTVPGSSPFPIPPKTSSEPPESPDIPFEIPKNIFVTPEVPFGTVALVIACFFALLIMQQRSKKKLP